MSEDEIVLRRYCDGEVTLEATRLALNVASADHVFALIHQRGLDDTRAILEEMRMVAPIWRAVRKLGQR
jgi:hypothetical protein